MKTALILFLLGAMTHAAELPMVFDLQPSHPTVGMPKEAELQVKAMRQMFKDHSNHGSLAQVLGDSLQSVTIHHFSKVWTDQKQVRDYLTGLLADESTQTYLTPNWSQILLDPEIDCALTFKNQKQGRLLLWGTVACVCDSAGRWWFVSDFYYFHGQHPGGNRSLAKKHPSRR